MKSLFQYAVIKKGKPATKDSPEEPWRVLIPPTEFALFEDEKAVTFAAIRAIPEGELDDPSRLEVAVRPF